jgi:ATP-dependent protease ClpP protease subunit
MPIYRASEGIYTMSDTQVTETIPYATAEIALLEQKIEISKALPWADQAERNLLDRLATLWETRIYFFEGEIDYDTLVPCLKTLGSWSRIDKDRKDKRMHIVINGHADFFPALTLAEYIRGLRLKGFHITVEIAGRASGQAVLPLSQANRRLMTASSWLNVDEVSIKAVGTTYLGENEVELNKKLDAQTRQMLCDSSSNKLKSQLLKSRTKGKTWNINCAAALKYGLIDEVAETRSASLADSVSLPFAPLPLANNSSDELKLAYIRKMRAEALLFELQNAEKLGDDSYNGVVRLFGSVSTESAKQAKIDLQVASRLSSSDVEVQICSRGGDVSDGWGFTNFCQQVRDGGRALNTNGIGQISSIAGVILQGGKIRRMSKNSWLMIHRVGSTFEDKTTKAQLEVEFCQKLERLSFQLLASRSNGLLTADDIMEHCRSNNWWLTADEALAHGFIDEVY